MISLYINTHTIKSILKYYETPINNPKNIHDDKYSLIKSELSQEEINRVIFNRKGLYYDLKYPLQEINLNVENPEETQASINEFIEYVDEQLEEQKTNFLVFRDLIVFFENKKVDLDPSGNLTESGDLAVKVDSREIEIIDEKIQTLYYVVFSD